MILTRDTIRAALDTWDGDHIVTKQAAESLLDHLCARLLRPDGQAAALLTGTLPPDRDGANSLDRELLITVWPDGSGEYATRHGSRWSPPTPLTAAP